MRIRLRDAEQALRAAFRTTVFLLKVMPMFPSRAIDWLTPEPVVERVRYPTPDGGAEGDLYRPSRQGTYPSMVVCLGVVPFEEDHPQVPRLGAALARAGFAALLYWSPAMRDVRLDPGDAERIALAYRWLIEQPGVDPERSGLLGTCVGGSFALLAAADPRIRERVGFVIAWAPFASMCGLATDIASATTRRGNGREPWVVDQLTRRVFVRSLTAGLSAEEAILLRDLCAERRPQAAPGGLSSDARRIFPLLTELDDETTASTVEQLPAGLQAQFGRMSPLGRLGEVCAPVIVLAHDVGDQVIPVGESRRIAAALAGRPGVRYTEFQMFQHLDPTKVRLPAVQLARELGKFYRSVYPVFHLAVVARSVSRGPAASPGRAPGEGGCAPRWPRRPRARWLRRRRTLPGGGGPAGAR